MIQPNLFILLDDIRLQKLFPPSGHFYNLERGGGKKGKKEREKKKKKKRELNSL